MLLGDLNECRSGNFSRLPLIACGQRSQFGKHRGRPDATAGDELLDVVDLADHSRAPSPSSTSPGFDVSICNDFFYKVSREWCKPRIDSIVCLHEIAHSAALTP